MGVVKTSKATEMNEKVKRESVVILVKILIANLVFAVTSIGLYYFMSNAPQVVRLKLLSLPIIGCLSLAVLLLLIHYKVKDIRAKTIALMILSYGLYILSVGFYFYLDTIPMVILTGLFYLFVTQILMDFKYTLLFGLTGIGFTVLLIQVRFGEDLDIGIGFGIAMIYLFTVAAFAVRRYIWLIRSYQMELENQVIALTDSEIRHEMLHQASKEVIWDYDVIKAVRQYSTNAISQYGDTLSDATQLEDWLYDIHPEDVDQFYKGYQSVLSGEVDQFEMEFRQLSRSGQMPWYFARVISKKDDQGNVIKIAGSYAEITDRKLKDMQVNFLAYNDILTGLPNRSAFFRDYDAWQMKDRETCVYLIFLDIMNFREFNSTFGHYSGDILLRQISERLEGIKTGHLRYQLTAIDFGLVGFGCDADFQKISEDILLLFKEPFYVGEQETFIDVKMGVAISPLKSTTAVDLLRNADTALYYCRKDPLIQYLVYSTDLTDYVTSKLSMSNLMRQALENNEFYVVFQPIVDVSQHTNGLYGFETLVRWNSPQLGLVRPDQFIPIAEETGLIIQMGEFILKESCKFIKKVASKMPNIVISVNLSAKQIASDQFLPVLFDIVAMSGIDPRNLCLEITESSFIESFESVKPKFEAIKKRGHTIALDDFGTGYSSLNYLGQLDIDTLKIDKSFSEKITDSGSDYYLIKSVITLSKDLNIRFVAEGVETESQLHLLKEVGCPLIQGYYFEKPLAEQEAIRYLDQFSANQRSNVSND